MNQQVNVLTPPPSGDALAPSWGSRLWYNSCLLIHAFNFNLGFSLRTEGMHNVPRSGPVLVIANHQSFLDPVVAGLAFRRHLIFLARKTLFRNPIFNRLIRSLNAVPIDQEGVGKEGLKTIIHQLQLGKAVLVFPEGERTPHGRMLPLKPGVHLLIKRAPVPILPIGIAGAYDALPRWRATPHLAPLFWPERSSNIAVSVGKPLDPRPFAEMPRAESLQTLFDELQKVQLRAEEMRRQK